MTDFSLSLPRRFFPRPLPGVPVLAIFLATLCFSLTPWFARAVDALGLSAEASALWRFALVAALVFPAFPRRPGVAQQTLMLIGAGSFAGLGYTALLAALAHGPVAGTIVIYMSYPLLAALLAWLLLGDRPTIRTGLAGLAIILAAALIAGPGAASALDPISILLLLPAPFSYALIVVAFARLTPDLKTLERLSATAVGTVISLLPSAIAAGPDRMLPGEPGGWILLAAFAIITAAIPQALFSWAAPRLTAAKVGALGAMELPLMLAVGALLLGEVLGPVEAAAAALALGGILLVQTERPHERQCGP